MFNKLVSRAMNFEKRTERIGDKVLVYFVDHLGRKQGILQCFRTILGEIREKNLLYTEHYQDDSLVKKEDIYFHLH